MQPFWGHIHHAKLVIDAANMQKTFRNDPKQHMLTSLILCMKMIQNLIVDYVFHFVIDCDFSHVSSQLLKLFS